MYRIKSSCASRAYTQLLYPRPTLTPSHRDSQTVCRAGVSPKLHYLVWTCPAHEQGTPPSKPRSKPETSSPREDPQGATKGGCYRQTVLKSTGLATRHATASPHRESFPLTLHTKNAQTIRRLDSKQSAPRAVYAARKVDTTAGPSRSQQRPHPRRAFRRRTRAANPRRPPSRVCRTETPEPGGDDTCAALPRRARQ